MTNRPTPILDREASDLLVLTVGALCLGTLWLLLPLLARVLS